MPVSESTSASSDVLADPRVADVRSRLEAAHAASAAPTEKAAAKLDSQGKLYVRDRIAQARIDIEMARLLTLKAAWLMDEAGNKAARQEIAAIKVAAPATALRVVDQAIQLFGGEGVTDDVPLAQFWAGLRALRLADGPDEVHLMTIARGELRRYRGDRTPKGGER